MPGEQVVARFTDRDATGRTIATVDEHARPPGAQALARYIQLFAGFLLAILPVGTVGMSLPAARRRVAELSLAHSLDALTRSAYTRWRGFVAYGDGRPNDFCLDFRLHPE